MADILHCGPTVQQSVSGGLVNTLQYYTPALNSEVLFNCRGPTLTTNPSVVQLVECSL